MRLTTLVPYDGLGLSFYFCQLSKLALGETHKLCFILAWVVYLQPNHSAKLGIMLC